MPHHRPPYHILGAYRERLTSHSLPDSCAVEGLALFGDDADILPWQCRKANRHRLRLYSNSWKAKSYDIKSERSNYVAMAFAPALKIRPVEFLAPVAMLQRLHPPYNS